MKRKDELEELNPELLRQLLLKDGELGFLSAEIAELYGGSELDKVSSSLIMERFSQGPSGFAISHMVHTGIGSLPIVLFGTLEQKKKYLPMLASGEMVGAFALTEPEHGSDALGAKTTAVLSPDKKYYILNGQKQFITNAGFADVYCTYAQVDGEKFTSFIVERKWEGVSLDAEEKKMGIHGSSTCSVVFRDVKVPVQNVLGEIGWGHVVALNTLSVGRYKIAALTLGVAKMLIGEGVRHAKMRIQFGKPICEFGLIKQKIAEMVIKTYIGESMVYRTAWLLDLALKDIDPAAENAGRKTADTLRGYAVECSIHKVFSSEMLDYVSDECVQIMGGYGYIQDNLAEGAYRDSRIHRIWEGTNEIMRLVIVDTLLRADKTGLLPLGEAFVRVKEKLGKNEIEADNGLRLLETERAMMARAKKMVVLVIACASEKYGDTLLEEQEVVGLLADMTIEIFAMESGLLRSLNKTAKEGEERSKVHRAAA
ncbi:MAG TPA: acyl-CoA dehydrogenase, partial [Candidatus Atribacteria bacterium]|nr:acyl-CoA dehydrogenase [Candidatus Atribacteria bacterium]